MEGKGGAWNTSSGRRSVSYVVISIFESVPTGEEGTGTCTSEARSIEHGNGAQYLFDARAEAAYASRVVHGEGSLGVWDGIPGGRAQLHIHPGATVIEAGQCSSYALTSC